MTSVLFYPGNKDIIIFRIYFLKGFINIYFIAMLSLYFSLFY